MPSHDGRSGDLRRSRRLDVGSLVTGELMPSGEPITIRDIGFGGFAVETTFAVEVGSVLDFQVTSKNGSAFILRACVVHTREILSPFDSVVHVSGLEFADNGTPRDERAEALIDKINWILSFYDEASRDSAERAEPDGPPAATRTRPRPRAERAP
jgi:PilZ domain